MRLQRIPRIWGVTFRRQLIVGVALMQALMMTLLIWNLSLRQTGMLRQRQHDHAVAMAQSMATSAAECLATSDVSGLQSILNIQSKYPSLKAAMFTDSSGKILAHTNLRQIGLRWNNLPLSLQVSDLSVNGRSLDIAVPVVSAGRHLGWVRVEIGRELIKRRVDQVVIQGVFLTFFAILLVSIMAWVMAERFTRRLYAIKQTIKEIKSGNYLARTELRGGDEAAELAAEFNLLLDTLSQREDALRQSEEELKRINANLETLVEQRTEQLQGSFRLVQARETELHKAQHVAHLGSWSLDIPNNNLVWSEETYHVFGVEPSTPMNLDRFLECIDPADVDRVVSAWGSALTGKKYDIEHRINVAGQTRWVREIAEVQFDEQGVALSGLGTVQDITDLKAAEAELIAVKEDAQESEKKLTNILNNTKIHLWLFNGTEYTFVSKEWYDFTGQPQDTPLTIELWVSAVHPEDLEPSTKVWSENWQLKREHDNYFRLRRFDGSYRYFYCHALPIFDDLGQFKYFQGFNVDITDQKQAEEMLHEAKDAADRANRSKSEFLANMSHEIRTPLNGIIGLTQLMQDTPLTSKQEDYLRKIKTSSRVLLDVLNDILDYSKIETGHFEIENVPFVLDDIFKSMTDIFSLRAEEKGLELYFEIGPEVPASFLGDPLRLSQVLNNLLGNAIKFTQQGEVHIRIEALARTKTDILLAFYVRDTGIGISGENNIFDAFIQADNSTTRKFGGTGLGLAISRKIVRAMSGDITYESTPGQGTVFKFTVRLSLNPSDRKTGNLHDFHGMRVLLADDQLMSRNVLKQLLESWSFSVESVETGHAAIATIEQTQQHAKPFDLFLLDWKMPGTDGLQVVKWLDGEVRNGTLKKAPIILMVNTLDGEDLLEQANFYRLEALLVKPVTPSALLDTIVDVVKNITTHRVVPNERQQLYARAASLQGAHVLLVEDNLVNQQVAQELLEKIGIRVTLAGDGLQAVELAGLGGYDAILMDQQMPNMDGLEATQRIRQTDIGKEVPIIAMTAAAMLQDREACLRAGMNDHIAKPINLDAFVATLKKWIRSGRYQAPVESSSGEKIPLAGFDLKLCKMLGVQAYSRILRSFNKDFIDFEKKLYDLVRERNYMAASDLAHSIKGASGNLGAMDLFKAAQLLEVDLKSSSSISLPRFTEIFAATLKSIDSYLASHGESLG